MAYPNDSQDNKSPNPGTHIEGAEQHKKGNDRHDAVFGSTGHGAVFYKGLDMAPI